LSNWDVSHVITMFGMFQGATSFNQALCGVAWVHSKALQEDMFKDSSGSICSRSTTRTTTNIRTGTVSPQVFTNSTVTAPAPYLQPIIIGAIAAIIAVIIVVVVVLAVMRPKCTTARSRSN